MQAQASRQLPLLRDRVVLDYLRHLGQRLVHAAGPQPFAYHFYVVRDDEVNAFAMPAGYIYVNTGLILKARNVSELAGVIGHEIGHVVKRHIAQNYNRQRSVGLAKEAGVMAAALTLGAVGARTVDLVGGLSAMAVLNSFGREAEREADAFAVEILPRAGYDPEGMVSFFHTMLAEGGPDVPTFLSSHPATRERIAEAQALIQRLPPQPDLRSDDGGRFEIIQERVRLLTQGASRHRGRSE